MESGGAIRWVRMRLVSGLACPVSRTSPSTCRLPTLVGLGVSPGGFRAESRTVLGKAQAPRVEASQGVYYSGFILRSTLFERVLVEHHPLLIGDF